MKLEDSIRYLKGVGPKREIVFRKLGIYTIKDLIYYFPRDYEDRTKIKKINELACGENVAFLGKLCGAITKVFTRSNIRIYKGTISDGTGFINLIWFNTDYVKMALKPNITYVFFGLVEQGSNGFEVRNPEFELPGVNERIGQILPIYPLTKDMTQSIIRKAILQAFSDLEDEVADIIPEDIREKEELCVISTALKNIHFPKDAISYVKARRRLAFEELLVLQLGLSKLKKDLSLEDEGISCKHLKETDDFIKKLPFELTNAQKRVVRVILEEMEKPTPMRRLLQGDVGSGKTIVAMIAILNAVKNGYQAVMMAPTSILAKQHFDSFVELLGDMGIKVSLLTSSLTVKEKRKLKEKIELGLTNVVIATHAVLEDDVIFNNLGLVITDEQHRFGVNQRVKISKKGRNPDTLVMTATPIPRTLALILYGDLDISVIDELPPNRKPVSTYLADSSLEERINIFIEKEISSGRQAYVVCALIEEGEEPDEKLKDVISTEKAYKKRFPNFNIEILHGKMKSLLKDDIINKFNNKEIDILISTTVIEVGVNVPNATLMVIENAERFGLASLHQLRGRVGRGSDKSYCILKCRSNSPDTIERMKIMVKSNNGFEIAKKDLEIRGPGEFLGIRQHGMPEFKIANIFADSELLEITTVVAKKILETPQDYEALFLAVSEKFHDVVL